jgi:putative membrane protein
MEFSNADHARISDAIRAAETRTSGEIVCVVARSSSDYSHVPVLWGAVGALAAPWPLMALTDLSVQRIFLAQIAVFVLLTLLLSLPALRMMLVPRSVRRARAHRAAVEQFFTRGLSRTKERNGILIYVSLAEHYARIVADEGMAAKAQQAEWQKAIDTLVAHAREDRMADGFIAAVDLCAEVLARHYPPGPDENLLPNRVYVI